ncbi:MAG TPA: hypothetical protein VHV28_01165 [Solirubrobacteraceae bacterium]|nr:hypothetical protein [Solirubrobacteraceae bacterium]
MLDAPHDLEQRAMARHGIRLASDEQLKRSAARGRDAAAERRVQHLDAAGAGLAHERVGRPRVPRGHVDPRHPRAQPPHRLGHDRLDLGGAGEHGEHDVDLVDERGGVSSPAGADGADGRLALGPCVGGRHRPAGEDEPLTDGYAHASGPDHSHARSHERRLTGGRAHYDHGWNRVKG